MYPLGRYLFFHRFHMCFQPVSLGSTRMAHRIASVDEIDGGDSANPGGTSRVGEVFRFVALALGIPCLPEIADPIKRARYEAFILLRSAVNLRFTGIVGLFAVGLSAGATFAFYPDILDEWGPGFIVSIISFLILVSMPNPSPTVLLVAISPGSGGLTCPHGSPADFAVLTMHFPAGIPRPVSGQPHSAGICSVAGNFFEALYRFHSAPPVCDSCDGASSG